MKKIKITKQSLKKLILPAIILIQLVLIGVLAWYVYWTRVDVRQQSTDKISSLIVRAIDGLTWTVPADAQTGRLYIREAKITLPPPPDRSYDLYYTYSPSFSGQPAELNLIDKQNVDMQKNKVAATAGIQAVFDIVPKLQACARGYQVFFTPAGKNDTTGKLVFTKKLKDGRTAYAYLENQCSDNKVQMIPYLQEMDSY